MQILPASENAEGIWQELHGWPLAYKTPIRRHVVVVWKKSKPNKKFDGLRMVAFLKGTLRCFLDFLGSNRLFQASGEFQRFVGKKRHFGPSNLISFVSVRILP